MKIKKEDLVSLLTNRQVFNKQYTYNTIQLLKHFSKDRLAITLLIAIIVLLAYEAMKDSIYIFMTVTVFVTFLVLFCYYAVRAHAYKVFTREKNESTLSFKIKILEGSIGAIYISQTTPEISKQVKLFLSENLEMSEYVQWILNTRFRKSIRAVFRKKENLVIKRVKDKYGIDIEFHIANLEQELVDLNGFKVTQAYDNYEQWKTLEIETIDIPWLICRIITILMLAGCLMFVLAVCIGLIG